MRKKSQNKMTFILDKAEIHSLSHEGRGMGKSLTTGKTVFIDGALPGEITPFIYRKHKKNFAEGQVFIDNIHQKLPHSMNLVTTSSFASQGMAIQNPSPFRTDPFCAHFGTCGGCALQHLKHSEQIVLKQKVLVNQLQHFGKITIDPKIILTPLLGLQKNYRRKARLSVKYVIKKQQVLIGFSEKNSHKVAEIEHCDILHPLVGEKLSAFKLVISQLKSYLSIPQIEIAVGCKEDKEIGVFIIRHLETLPAVDLESLTTFASENHLYLIGQPKGPDSLYAIWPECSMKDFRLSYSFPDYNATLFFHPLDFTQIHYEINQQMVKLALQLLDPKATETILDLFCGLGNFTIPIARFAKEVVGLEGCKNMVQRATENARFNHIQNAFFYEVDLALNDLQLIKNKTFDKVLLDPPRSGTSKHLLEVIAQNGAKKVVYVSCNPATLARDVGILVHEYGYQLKQTGIMDMFPHTAHVESIALLEK